MTRLDYRSADRRRSAVAGTIWVLAVLPLPFSAPATEPAVTTHVVSTTADDGPESLRAALEAAAGTPGSDRIEFGNADGPFGTPQSIELASSLPPIRGEVTIDGRIKQLLWTAYGVTVSGGGEHRAFDVGPGATLRLLGVTVVDGRAENGGAILNRGRLVVEGVSLLRNQAGESGGAIANDSGTVLLINTTAADNRAGRGGAVANLGGDLRVTNSTLYRNEAAEGGAVYSNSRLEMANSILAGNGLQCMNTGSLAEGTTHNLITSHEGCGEPILTTDPHIGPFGYYNGPTPVFAVEGGSPIINLASTEAATGEDGLPLRWDQRGNGDPRFAFGYADLGAFERQGHLPTEFLVDRVEDNGLRGCTIVGKADCPLRAALELAAAARNPTPVRFDPAVFSEPRSIRLEELPTATDQPLTLDGSNAAAVTVILSGRLPPWQTENGVRIEADHSIGAGSD